MRPATRAVLCQCRTTLALMFQTFAQGMSQGWSSQGVMKLKNGEGPFVPTKTEVDWIVSLFDIGVMAGAVISFFMFMRTGRRQTLLVAPLAFALWITLTCLAKSAAYLYAARIFAGIGMGVNFTFSSIYIGEVTTPVMRSVLIMVMTLLAPLGELLCFVIAPYVSYWEEGISPTPFVFKALVCTYMWTQETPYYLSMLGRHEDSLRELTRLRQGTPLQQIQCEAAEIRRSVQQQLELEGAASWRETGARRASVIVLVLCGLQALFGANVVLSYTKTIFQESGTELSSTASSELVSGVKVVMIVAAMYLVEKLGRRLLLSTTALINGLAMTAMALYFLVKEHLDLSIAYFKWVPILTLMAFMVATSGGVIPVCYVLFGELLSLRAKKIVAPIAAVIFAGTTLVISKSFPIIGDSVGFCVPFGFFAIINLFVSGFTLAQVPETKGKTLAEVQEDLRNKGKGEPTL